LALAAVTLTTILILLAIVALIIFIANYARRRY
jgi:hypothetical protein